MDNFDPYHVFLAIATNIPQRFKTGFVVQGHFSSIFTLSIVILSKFYSTFQKIHVDHYIHD